jgi:hypothetical protein
VSPDTTAKPLIVHNYFAEPDDMRSQVAGVRMCMELVHTAPLAGWVSETLAAPASDTDADITAFVRARTHDLPPCRELQDGRR